MARLCVDFGGTNIKMGLARNGVLASTREFPVGGAAGDLDAVVAAAASLGAEPGEIDVVALAVPGLIDAAGTRLALAHGKYDWMIGADLVEWAQRSFGAVGIVENDARAALIGEVASGSAAGETDAVILVLGTGIGTAAMVDGQMLRGASGAGGNLGGHVTIDWNGPACNCGNIGCAEVFGGSWALRDRVADLVEISTDGGSRALWRERFADAAPLGFAELLDRAESGDTIAVLARDQAIRAWAVVAVTCCHLVEPSAIVIAGGVARAAGHVVPVIQEYVREHIWRVLPMPRFIVSDAPELSVLRGLMALGGPA
jgi:glucokinase